MDINKSVDFESSAVRRGGITSSLYSIAPPVTVLFDERILDRKLKDRQRKENASKQSINAAATTINVIDVEGKGR